MSFWSTIRLRWTLFSLGESIADGACVSPWGGGSNLIRSRLPGSSEPSNFLIQDPGLSLIQLLASCDRELLGGDVILDLPILGRGSQTGDIVKYAACTCASGYVFWLSSSKMIFLEFEVHEIE